MDKLRRVPHSMMLLGAVNRAMERSPFTVQPGGRTCHHVAPGEGLWALSPPRSMQNADTILPFEVSEYYFGNVVLDKSRQPRMLSGSSMGR